MKGGKQPPGFTIVEVMIVLAVSGLIFLAAATLIAGKQNRTGFITTINDLTAQLQQNINDVINGRYPKFSNSSFNCVQGVGQPPSIASTGATGSGQQGTHGGLNSNGTLNGCVFLGTAVQFAVGAQNSSVLAKYPLIGNLEGSNGLPSQSLSDSYPELLAPGSSTNSAFSDEFVQQYTMDYGLRVDWMCYSTTSTPCSNTTNAEGVIFATSPESSGGGNSLTRGSQQLEFLPIPTGAGAGGSLGSSSTNAVDYIDNFLTNSTGWSINPVGGVEVCVADDSTNQSGLFTIGGGGSLPNVTLSVKDATTKCS